jgi:hypothetical protein
MTIAELIPEAKYAKDIRGVCLRTAQRERAQRMGPPFIKLGRKVYYRPAAIEAWLIAQEQVQPRARGVA